MRYPTIEPLESRIAPATVSPGTVFIQDHTLLEGSSGTSFAVFVVSLDHPVPAGDHVTIDFATADGTAHSSGTLADFTATASQLTFAEGEISKTITIAVSADTAYELDEQFTVKLSNPKILDANNAPAKDGVTGTVLTLSLAPGMASGLAGVATGFIQNDDALPTLSITGPTGPVSEGVGTVGLTVSLSNPADYDVIVTYGTVDGTALGGTPNTGDFTKISHGTVTIPRGATSAQISVAITNDNVIEPDKTFQVELESGAFLSGPNTPLGIDTDHSAATVNLQDDDPSASIVSTASVREGNNGITHLDFAVTLSQAALEPVVIHYKTLDGTAHSVADESGGIDFVGVEDGTLTIQPGETHGTITIDINGDTDVEASETFTVQLTSADHAHLVTHTESIGTILNDDGPSHFQILGDDSGSLATVAEGGKTVTLTIVRSGDTTQAGTVVYSTHDGTALSSEDYAAKTATVSFAANETSKKITIPIIDDTRYEGAQQFTVSLSDPTGGDVPAEHEFVAVTITDNDAPPVVTIGNASTLEGGGLIFSVKLDHASDFPVVVHYSTKDIVAGDGTAAVAGLDYTAVVDQTLTIAPGATTGTITIATLADRLQEKTESMQVELSNPDAGLFTIGVNGTGIGTGNIVDLPNVLSIASATQLEGSDPAHPNSMTFIVTLDRANDADTSFSYKTIDGTGINGAVSIGAGADFVSIQNGMLVIPAGSTQGEIVITLNPDTLSEGNETFSVQLSDPVNATLGVVTAIGTITNDDTVPNVSISDGFAVEGNNVQFTVTLSGPSDGPITLNALPHELSGISTVPGAGLGHTAKANADFSTTPITVTIPAGQTSATFTVTTRGNSNFEEWRQFSVDLTGAPGLQQTTVTGTILDDDIALSANGRTVLWHDVDGDLVTLAVSKGKLSSNNVFFLGGAPNSIGGVTLSELDLFYASFQHANVSITSSPDPLFAAMPGILQSAGVTADFGHVNVGFIRANAAYDSLEFSIGVDLGTVTVGGDLARIDVGDLYNTLALRSLNVYSLGKQGTATGAPSSESHIVGPLKSAKIETDLAGSLHVVGLKFGNIGSLTVGTLDGSLFTTDNAGSVTFSGTLSKAKIGSIIGGNGNASGGVYGAANAVTHIGSIAVAGAITGGGGAGSGEIVATTIGSASASGLTGGSGAYSGSISADGSIKSVSIGYGGMTGGAGQNSGAITTLGGSISKVDVNGSLLGGGGANSGSINVLAGVIQKAHVAGGLTGGAGVASGSIWGAARTSTSSGALGFVSVVVDGGLQGGAGASSGSITAISGSILKVTVKGDLQGFITPVAEEAIVGGSQAGSIVASSLGTVVVGEGLLGGPGSFSGSVYAKGGSISKVTIGEGLEGGVGETSGSINGSSIGTVTIKAGVTGGAGSYSGSIFASNYVAKVTVADSVTGGAGASSAFVGATAGDLGSVVVKGDLIGGDGATSGALGSGGTLKSAVVNGSLIGGFGSQSGVILGRGGITSASVGGSLKGGDGFLSGSIYSDRGHIIKAIIGASLIGGDGEGSGAVATGIGNINQVLVNGDLTGGFGDASGAVRAGGALLKATIKGGLNGNDGEDSGSVEALRGNIGTVTIGKIADSDNAMSGGDGLTSGSVVAFAGGIKALTLGGDILGGSIRAHANIASLIVNGSVSGTDEAAVEITAGGITSSIAINKISISGDVSYTEILAGYDADPTVVDPRGTPISGDASIGTVTIGGSIKAVSIVAGVLAGDDGDFGSDDDTQITKVFSTDSEIDIPTVPSRIARIIVGSIESTGSFTTYGIAANFVDSIKIGVAPAFNPVDGTELDPPSNIFVREVEQPPALPV